MRRKTALICVCKSCRRRFVVYEALDTPPTLCQSCANSGFVDELAKTRSAILGDDRKLGA